MKDSLYSTGDVNPDLIRNLSGDIIEELVDYGGNLIAAHYLFKRFAYLFAGVILSNTVARDSCLIFGHMSAEEAFNVVEIELGFMYDVLYTKATIAYSRLGIILRCVSFLNSVSALFIFSIMIDIHDYSLIDISITYLLLVSAVILEVYVSVLHFFSDWTKLCLTPFKSKKPKIYNATCSLLDFPFFNHKRWSGSMGQFNLLSYCFKDMLVAKCIGVDKLFRINKYLEKYMFLSREDANDDLKQFIFDKFFEKARRYCNDSMPSKEILSGRGNHVLEHGYRLGTDFLCFTVEIGFQHSLFIWHLATDLCYFNDFDKCRGAKTIHPGCEIAKTLSDYMLYLLVLRPSMMPEGIAGSEKIAELKPVSNLKPESMFTKTCNMVMKLAKSNPRLISDKTSEVCKVLLETMVQDSEVDDNGPNVIVAGCQLAKRLQSLESQDTWSKQRKWEMISEVWVEMLGFAASHCEWREHAQQLWKGGELLTHVCLLMAHLGLSSQYRDYAKEIP